MKLLPRSCWKTRFTPICLGLLLPSYNDENRIGFGLLQLFSLSKSRRLFLMQLIRYNTELARCFLFSLSSNRDSTFYLVEWTFSSSKCCCFLLDYFLFSFESFTRLEFNSSSFLFDFEFTLCFGFIKENLFWRLLLFCCNGSPLFVVNLILFGEFYLLSSLSWSLLFYWFIISN